MVALTVLTKLEVPSEVSVNPILPATFKERSDIPSSKLPEPGDGILGLVAILLVRIALENMNPLF